MRSPGWRGRLHRYITEARGVPFAYGTHDCTLFACGAVRAITGADPGLEYRGRYATYARGLVLLRQAGLMDHVDLFRSLYEAIRPQEAILGDVAVVMDAEGPALGVVQGSGLIFVLTQGGMQMIEMTDPRVTAAFRIE